MPRTLGIFCSKIAIFSQSLSVFKKNKIDETNDKFVKLFFNNFYPVTSHRRVQKESNELLYTVLVRNQLPAQVVNTLPRTQGCRLSKKRGEESLKRVTRLSRVDELFGSSVFNICKNYQQNQFGKKIEETQDIHI